MYGPSSSPHNPENLYVSCNMGGPYVSLDGAKQWHVCMFDQAYGSTTTRTAFHPTDPNVMYMPWGGKVCVSKDNGRN